MAITIDINAKVSGIEEAQKASANLTSAFRTTQEQMAQMERATTQMSAKSVNALQQLSQQGVVTAFGQGALGKAFLQTGQAAGASATELQRFKQQHEQLKQQSEQSARSSDLFARSLSGVRQALNTIGAGLGITGLVQFTKSIIDAGIQYERFQRTLQAATGTAESGQRALAFLTAESNRLGQSLTAMVPTFAQLAAATRGTTLEGEKTRALFSALAGAGVAVGLSTEATGRAMVGLIQIISQNAIQLDELRSQFGSQIPGALRETAKALGQMGVTASGSISEMLSLIEKGTLPVDTLMQAVTQGLKEVAATAPDMSKSVEVAFQQASNAAFKLKADLAQSGLLELYKEILETSRGYIASIGRAVGVAPPDFLRQQMALQAQVSELRQQQREAQAEAADPLGFDASAAQARANAIQKGPVTL